MGTAPRSPAHDRNAWSRHGTRNHTRDDTTDNGRASSTSTAVTASAGSTTSGSRDGVTSSPSSTNRPIWASQPSEVAKPRVAAPCGRRLLPSTRAET